MDAYVSGQHPYAGAATAAIEFLQASALEAKGISPGQTAAQSWAKLADTHGRCREAPALRSTWTSRWRPSRTSHQPMPSRCAERPTASTTRRPTPTPASPTGSLSTASHARTSLPYLCVSPGQGRPGVIVVGRRHKYTMDPDPGGRGDLRWWIQRRVTQIDRVSPHEVPDASPSAGGAPHV